MAWNRRKGRRYYNGKVRDGEKIRSVYLGKGLVGDLFARGASGRRLLARWRKEAKADGYSIEPEIIELAKIVFGTNFRETFAYRRAQTRPTMSCFRRHGSWRRICSRTRTIGRTTPRVSTVIGL